MVVSPYFYPTTTVLIDDHETMLRSLCHSLDLKKKPHKSFIYPKDALAFINGDHYREAFSKRLFNTEQEDEGDSLTFNPRCLLSELASPDRFDQVSVVIVDYEMPGMNGMELCTKIENPSIKKILLTGVADEKIAIEAFNQGIIDLYIRKHDPDFIVHLQQALVRLQHEYFQDLFQIPLQALASRSESSALLDPLFGEMFDQIVIDHNIQEYYLVEAMGSFLMRGDNQTLYSLITVDDDIIDIYLNSKSTEKLTSQQRTSLAQKDLIPCYYHPWQAPYSEPAALNDFLHRPTVITGAQKTFYSVFGEGFIQVDGDNLLFWDSVIKKR